MYGKNLTEDLRLRLSATDMDFLRELSIQRSVSISECIRSIIAQYRQATETLNVLKKVANLAPDTSLSDASALASAAASALASAANTQNYMKGEGLSSGDTKTDFNDKL